MRATSTPLTSDGIFTVILASVNELPNSKLCFLGCFQSMLSHKQRFSVLSTETTFRVTLQMRWVQMHLLCSMVISTYLDTAILEIMIAPGED